MVNLLMGSQFSYRAVTYMDSDNFCGRACHKVMDPEYTAHSVSPHSNVACTDCHIGPGASSFVKAKLSGARTGIWSSIQYLSAAHSFACTSVALGA